MAADDDDDDDYCKAHLPNDVVTRLEAGAFRELCRHLQERSDSVQNMDLMTLSGFCRNCLAKWMVLEARRMVDQQQDSSSSNEHAITDATNNNRQLDDLTVQALNAMGYDEAAQHVYGGMSYTDWKARHQKKATDEQMEKFKASSHLHAKHDKALLQTRRAVAVEKQPASSESSAKTSDGATGTTVVTQSSVCCQDVEQVAASAAQSKTTTAVQVPAAKGTRTLPPYQPAPMPKISHDALLLRIGVLTVSDRAFAKKYATGDLSGPAVVQTVQDLLMKKQQSSSSSPLATTIVTSIVPDDIAAIQQQIKSWCGNDSENENNAVDLILTTGGTGFSPRDVTPEATRPLLQQECAGIMTFCATECSKLIQPLASLSRGTAGILAAATTTTTTTNSTSTTMIANLPGNPKAIAEIMPLLLPLLLHALQDLRGGDTVVQDDS